MNRNKLVLFILVLGVLVLSSCAGLPKGTGTGGGGSQNATLTLTMISQSQAKPSTYTLLAFNAQISSLTINESGGNSVPLVLTPSPYPVDFVRLSTDTALLGTFTVPPNILFSNATLALTNITITLHNESGGSIGSCPDGAICEFTPPPALATISSSPFASAFTSGTAYNFYLNVIPDDIIVTSAAGLSLNFTQNTPISSIQLPRAGAAANTLDSIQDFTGKVVSISGNTVSIKNGSGVGLTATIGGSATLDDDEFQTTCAAGTIAGCVVMGAVVSIDGTISTTGVLTANEFDLLDTTLKDDIEGVIFSTGPGTFDLVVTDKQDAGDLPTLTAANIGDVFVVNGTSTASYIVDTKNLSTANPPVPVNLFASQGDLLSGQQVRLHVTAASGSAASANQTLTADVVQLRFSRVTAQAGSVSGTIFNIDDLGSTTESLYGTAASSFQVQTFSATTYDNTANGINGIAMAGANDASIRALYINNIFYAAAARHQ